MTNQIFIETTNALPTSKKQFEIVERKGLGHPDTICDLVMNQVSIDLSKLTSKKLVLFNTTTWIKHYLWQVKVKIILGEGK